MWHKVLRILVLSLSAAQLPAAIAGAFLHPIDAPATFTKRVATSALQSIAYAGGRTVAVGQRGHIVFSDDGGKTWQQAKVPVSVDLVAVSFPSARKGWAVGHFGVVLHSDDGGLTWSRQLNGKQAVELPVMYYETQGVQGPDEERVLRQLKGQVEDGKAGEAQPFLDVLFKDEKSGFIVGAFNRIFHTNDGGKTWIPWMTRIDNPEELHLYALAGVGDNIYIVGERGKVWRLDSKQQRFVMVPTPYNGSLFGAVVDASYVLVFGMRGSVFRSSDGGKNWEQVAVPSPAGITDGCLLPDGRILLVNLSGKVMQSADQGRTFVRIDVANSMSAYYGIAPVANGKIGLVGSESAQIEVLR